MNQHSDDLYDATGLATPILQREHLRLALKRAHRSRSHVAVLFIDVDDTAGLDRQWGDGVGARVLVELGDRIRARFRDTDVTTRLEGDEFVIVCEGLDEPAHVGRLVRRIHDALTDPFDIDGLPITLRASIGSAVSPGGDWPGHLVNSAEHAKQPRTEAMP